MVDALVARSFILLDRQADAPVGRQELDRTLRRRPSRLEIRQGSTDLTKVDTVTAGIWATSRGVLDLGIGHSLAHDLGQIAHPVVLIGCADVERLIVNE